MLCAGLTAYSPLVRNGAGPGKKVGIVGIGGIGHLGVLLAKALGAEVWAISRSRGTSSKEADCRAMGVDGFLATGDGPGWADGHEMTFDLIVNTANSTRGFDLDAHLRLLDVHGKFVSVGLPEGDEGFRVRRPNETLLANGCFMGSSHLGSRRETLEMLQLAADAGIRTWVEELPMGREGLREAMCRMERGEARYRICMTGYDEVFGR